MKQLSTDLPFDADPDLTETESALLHAISLSIDGALNGISAAGEPPPRRKVGFAVIVYPVRTGRPAKFLLSHQGDRDRASAHLHEVATRLLKKPPPRDVKKKAESGPTTK